MITLRRKTLDRIVERYLDEGEMTDDIVAFLDRWLNANYDETAYSDIKPVTVRRARDEIVALRERRADIRRVVLEQAALIVEGSTDGGSIFAAERVAARIRALKVPGQ